MREEINVLKIDKTYLSPDEVAGRVIAAFGLVPNDKDDGEYRCGVEEERHGKQNRDRQRSL